MAATTTATQRCPRCSKDLPLAAFYERHRGWRGNYCAECSRAYLRLYKRNLALARKLKCGLPRHPVFIPMPRPPQRPKPKSTNYRDVHKRIQRARGPASDHPCVAAHCDQLAHHWAYDHTDPGEITAQQSGYIIAFSTDPAYYLPLCRSCHSKFDQHCGRFTLLVAAEEWAAMWLGQHPATLQTVTVTRNDSMEP